MSQEKQRAEVAVMCAFYNGSMKPKPETVPRVAILTRSSDLGATLTEVALVQSGVECVPDVKDWCWRMHGLDVGGWKVVSSTPDPDGVYKYKDSSMDAPAMHRVTRWEQWFGNQEVLFAIHVEDVMAPVDRRSIKEKVSDDLKSAT